MPGCLTVFLRFDGRCFGNGLRLERIDFVFELADFRMRSAPSRIGCDNFVKGIVTDQCLAAR